MKIGTYRTAAGSTVTISGKYGGIATASFDWLEEDHACFDCRVDPYPVDGYLTWQCQVCGGGSAKLEREQSLGANGCVRFDHDGPQQGTMLRDDPPEPLYEDCYSTEARDDS